MVSLFLFCSNHGKWVDCCQITFLRWFFPYDFISGSINLLLLFNLVSLDYIWMVFMVWCWRMLFLVFFYRTFDLRLYKKVLWGRYSRFFHCKLFYFCHLIESVWIPKNRCRLLCYFTVTLLTIFIGNFGWNYRNVAGLLEEDIRSCNDVRLSLH